MPGYAIGGVSVGEPKDECAASSAHTRAALPADKPRYLMGVGTPEDLVEGVAHGVDMFDCVMPTRNARNGHLFTRFGDLRHAQRRYQADARPIDEPAAATRAGASRAPTCTTWTAAARCWRRLASIHNLHYYLNLMREMRAAIEAGQLRRRSRAGRAVARRAPLRRPTP